MKIEPASVRESPEDEKGIRETSSSRSMKRAASSSTLKHSFKTNRRSLANLRGNGRKSTVDCVVSDEEAFHNYQASRKANSRTNSSSIIMLPTGPHRHLWDIFTAFFVTVGIFTAFIFVMVGILQPLFLLWWLFFSFNVCYSGYFLVLIFVMVGTF